MTPTDCSSSAARKRLPVGCRRPHDDRLDSGSARRARLGSVSLQRQDPADDARLKDATADVKTVKAWWHRWPSANVAIATGAGFVVVDIDGEQGSESLESCRIDTAAAGDAERLNRRGRAAFVLSHARAVRQYGRQARPGDRHARERRICHRAAQHASLRRRMSGLAAPSCRSRPRGSRSCCPRRRDRPVHR